MNDFVSTAVIALGSNLPQPEGDPAANLKRAIGEMAGRGLVIRRISRFFETPCFPPGAGPDYVNAVVVVSANSEPRAVLDVLHDIEADMGRTRDTRWGMRTLDLDLIAYGDVVLPNLETVREWVDLPAEDQRLRAPDELIVPHPRLADRAFVLVPMADVLPQWAHPITGLTVSQMSEHTAEADRKTVRAI